MKLEIIDLSGPADSKVGVTLGCLFATTAGLGLMAAAAAHKAEPLVAVSFAVWGGLGWVYAGTLAGHRVRLVLALGGAQLVASVGSFAAFVSASASEDRTVGAISIFGILWLIWLALVIVMPIWTTLILARSRPSGPGPRRWSSSRWWAYPLFWRVVALNAGMTLVFLLALVLLYGLFVFLVHGVKYLGFAWLGVSYEPESWLPMPEGMFYFWGAMALLTCLVFWRRSMRWAFSTLRWRSRDRPAPVLLLRSFGDDGLEAKGLEFHETRFETLLADKLGNLGPVIAIGQPGRPPPPLGAVREYVANDLWRERVVGFVRESQLIVVILGLTPGLRWEIQMLAGMGQLTRVVFILPPTTAEDRVARWVVFREQLAESQAAAGGWPELASADRFAGTAVAGFLSDPGGLTLYVAKPGSIGSGGTMLYELALEAAAGRLDRTVSV